MANFFFDSQSFNAWENLAADEWFLGRVGKDDLALYFYVNDPAVIIGKNQNPWTECDLAAMERDGVRLVRRVTGGGAVYHDRGNLNVSFIAGENRYDREKQTALMLAAVRAAGAPAEVSGRNDLTAGGRKFSGHAFTLRRGAGQHHATILIRTDLERLASYLLPDPRKIRSKGISSVRSRVCDLSEFAPDLTVEEMKRRLLDACRAEYGEFDPIEPPKEEIAPFYEKHSSREWLYGATPKFDYERDERFSFGSLRLLLSLEKGRVSACTAYTDANNAALPEILSRALSGVPFSAEAIADALAASPAPEAAELAAAFRAGL